MQPPPVQQEIPLPPAADYQILGELFDTYIVVQGAQEAWLIDKHAAHERILFEKLRAQRQEVTSQTLLTGQVCPPGRGADGAAAGKRGAAGGIGL